MGNCKSQTLDQVAENNVDEPIYDFNKAKVLRVYDGDTIIIAARYNNKISKFHARLYGIDCPEIRSRNEFEKTRGLEAKKFLKNWIEDKIIDVDVLNNRKYEGRMMKEKYGRLLIIAHINHINIAKELISKGHGSEYYGGKK